jgi:hypothetical protein
VVDQGARGSSIRRSGPSHGLLAVVLDDVQPLPADLADVLQTAHRAAHRGRGQTPSRSLGAERRAKSRAKSRAVDVERSTTSSSERGQDDVRKRVGQYRCQVASEIEKH